MKHFCEWFIFVHDIISKWFSRSLSDYLSYLGRNGLKQKYISENISMRIWYTKWCLVSVIVCDGVGLELKGNGNKFQLNKQERKLKFHYRLYKKDLKIYIFSWTPYWKEKMAKPKEMNTKVIRIKHAFARSYGILLPIGESLNIVQIGERESYYHLHLRFTPTP